MDNYVLFFFSSRRRHTRLTCDWSSDVCSSDLTPPRAGAVRFKGQDISGQPPHRVFRLGVGYVPEGRQIFPHLDVGENLRLAARPAGDGPGWTLERIFEYFPILRERWRQRGRSLSGGEQQML